MSSHLTDGQIPGTTTLDDATKLAERLAEQGHVEAWCAVVGKFYSAQQPRRNPRRWWWGVRFQPVPRVESLEGGGLFEPERSFVCNRIAAA